MQLQYIYEPVASNLVPLGGKCVGFKRQLQSLKRELKGWEAMFERKHGHKPTKVC